MSYALEYFYFMIFSCWRLYKTKQASETEKGEFQLIS